MKKYYALKLTIILSIFAYYILFSCLIYVKTWNYMEQWTWIIGGSFPFIASILYLVCFERKFDPVLFFKNKKEYYHQQKYIEFNFDIGKLNTLYGEERILIDEIKELEGN